jgi:transcriptional regulator with XRE-family HTH domain
MKPTLKYSDPNYVIGKIKRLCEKRGYSFYQLAEECDMPVSSVYNMINRRSAPKLETLERICFGLHISLSDFFKDDDTSNFITEDENEIISIYRDFQSNEREHFKQYTLWYKSFVNENSNKQNE